MRHNIGHSTQYMLFTKNKGTDSFSGRIRGDQKVLSKSSDLKETKQFKIAVLMHNLLQKVFSKCKPCMANFVVVN